MKRANWNHVMAWATLFAIFGTGSVRAGTNAWTSIGPEGGGIKALSVDPHHPGTLYAATENPGTFTFKSTGGSDRWVKSGVPNKPLVFDPQDPDTIYAIDDGVFKSTDGGTSWNPANSGLPSFRQVFALAIDPFEPSTLYAGTNLGIFKSTDGGTNWSPASSGLPLYYPFPGQPPGPGDGCTATPSNCQPRPPVVDSLVIDPQNPSTLYAFANGVSVNSGTGQTVYAVGGLVKSTDGGGSWNTLDVGLPQSHDLDVRLAIDSQNPSTLYVGTNYGIFKSTDGGAGWRPVNSGLPPFVTGLPPFPIGLAHFLSVAIAPRQPDTVYAVIANSFGSRIFKTTTGGASWSDAGSGLPEGTLISSLQIDPQIYRFQSAAAIEMTAKLRQPATLYAGTSVGVFKSTDGGTRWTAANSGLTAIVITDVAIDPRNANTLYAATSIGLVKTTDGGTNWSPPNSNVGRWTLAIDPQNTSTVFAPGCTPSGSGVFGCGVFKSTDGGTSWSASWIAQDPGFGVIALAIDPRNSNIVYAMTAGLDCDVETLHKSVDGGMNWSHSPFKNMGVLAVCVSELVVDPQDSRNLYAAFQYGGVFKSTDAGATWNAANSGLTPGTSFPVYNTVSAYYAVALAIDPGSPSTVYTVSSSGVFKSSDGGMSWNPARSGLPDWSSELEDCCDFHPRLAVDPQNSARVYLSIGIGGAQHHVFQSSNGGASWTDSLVLSGAWFVGGLAISSQGPGTVYAGSLQGLFAMTFPPGP